MKFNKIIKRKTPSVKRPLKLKIKMSKTIVDSSNNVFSYEFIKNKIYYRYLCNVLIEK